MGDSSHGAVVLCTGLPDDPSDDGGVVPFLRHFVAGGEPLSKLEWSECGWLSYPELPLLFFHVSLLL
jgi:hypothetical protein